MFNQDCSNRQDRRPRRIRNRVRRALPIIVLTFAWLISLPASAQPSAFVPLAQNPAGEYGGIAYVEHFGLFTGVTAKGPFAMPYQLFAPVDPANRSRSNAYKQLRANPQKRGLLKSSL